MRWSRAFIRTLREDPSDAEVPSHRLLVRGGFISKLASGIYNYLPLGWRSIRKLEAIVREEMDRAGSQELAMPAVQPSDLWERSGRWQQYGPELLRFKDRHGRWFCFGPTHEEVITDIVGRAVKSYRQLPMNLYQIQTKFRDEVRPRFGLMRAREFIMKDAYSFHASWDSLNEAYRAMEEAYCRVFERCGLNYTKVEADTGNIGGSESHEFMVLADTGEDAIIACSCGYSANVEKATAKEIPQAPPWPLPPKELPEEVHTPGLKSVEEVAEFLGVAPAHLVKTLVMLADGEPVVALVRGDRELGEVKLRNVLGATVLEMADAETIERVTGGPMGFSGPVGLEGVTVVADPSVMALEVCATGANKEDYHLVGVVPGRDFKAAVVADITSARAGDPCPHCGEPMFEKRGIEVGHIFKLGTKYSVPMKCFFLDQDGNQQPMIMGCYGLGIGRTVAAAVEQNHDEKGIIWPVPLAPYEVVVNAVNMEDPKVRELADRIYQSLLASGADVILDDRDERPGVKFNDIDLIGFPVRVVVGKRGAAEGAVEISVRRDPSKVEKVSAERAVDRVRGLLSSLTPGES